MTTLASTHRSTNGESRISAAGAADAAQIAEIYNAGVAGGLATFDCGRRSVADVETWLTESVAFVVAGDGERLAGFARAAAYSDSCDRAAGFEEVGVQRRHGRRAGRWSDCVLVERLLGPAADSPGSA